MKNLLELPQVTTKHWWLGVEFEKQHGSSQQLLSILQTATQKCRQEEGIWLLFAAKKRENVRCWRTTSFHDVLCSVSSPPPTTDHRPSSSQYILCQCKLRPDSPNKWLLQRRLSWCVRISSQLFSQSKIRNFAVLCTCWDSNLTRRFELYNQQIDKNSFFRMPHDATTENRLRLSDLLRHSFILFLGCSKFSKARNMRLAEKSRAQKTHWAREDHLRETGTLENVSTRTRHTLHAHHITMPNTSPEIGTFGGAIVRTFDWYCLRSNATLHRNLQLCNVIRVS